MTDDDKDARAGSGNFLRDRGYGDPDLVRQKFFVANGIGLIVEALGITRAEAAKIAGCQASALEHIIDGSGLESDLHALQLIYLALDEHRWKLTRKTPPIAKS